MEIAESERAATVLSLGRAARIIVHTLADVTLLDRFGLTSRTALMPHPAPAVRLAPIRNLPLDAIPIIGSTGFFLPNKGLGQLIKTVARLGRRWPFVRLRLVNAEYDDPTSAAEIAACRELATAEGVTVEWHTDFISQEEQQASAGRLRRPGVAVSAFARIIECRIAYSTWFRHPSSGHAAASL